LIELNVSEEGSSSSNLHLDFYQVSTSFLCLGFVSLFNKSLGSGSYGDKDLIYAFYLTFVNGSLISLSEFGSITVTSYTLSFKVKFNFPFLIFVHVILNNFLGF